MTVVVSGTPPSSTADTAMRCRNPIGLGLFVLATAALVVVIAIHFDDLRAAIPAYAVLVVVLSLQTWIDLRTQRLPREITYIGLAIGAPLLVAAALVIDEPERIGMMVLGAGVALGVLWLLHAVSRTGMGEGDVRLAPLLGLYLGWLNPGLVLVGLFFAFVAGATVGVGLLATGRVERNSALAFGPFLAAGTIVAIVVGQQFIDIVMAP